MIFPILQAGSTIRALFLGDILDRIPATVAVRGYGETRGNGANLRDLPVSRRRPRYPAGPLGVAKLTGPRKKWGERLSVVQFGRVPWELARRCGVDLLRVSFREVRYCWRIISYRHCGPSF